jgi:hypothetical protein
MATKKKKSKPSVDAHGGALNWSLVIGAVLTAFAPPLGLLASGVAVSAGVWAAAGVSTALALAAGNVKPAPKKTDECEP